MKLGHTNDEIKFDGTFSTVARYLVILDGEPTMRILCDAADPDMVIKIVRVDGGVPQDTKGRFEMKADILEDADGEPLGVGEPRVDEISVYKYAVPRLATLLGRLLRAA